MVVDVVLWGAQVLSVLKEYGTCPVSATVGVSAANVGLLLSTCDMFIGAPPSRCGAHHSRDAPAACCPHRRGRSQKDLYTVDEARLMELVSIVREHDRKLGASGTATDAAKDGASQPPAAPTPDEPANSWARGCCSGPDGVIDCRTL